MTSPDLWPLTHRERANGSDLLATLRRAGLADLDGDGLPTLTSRMP